MDEQDSTKRSKFAWLFSWGVTDIVIVAVIGGVAGFGGAWVGLVSKDHELKIKLVEIGISILRADPKENLTPARSWAITVIEKSSGYEFSEEDRKTLLSKPILGNFSPSTIDSIDYSSPSIPLNPSSDKNH